MHVNFFFLQKTSVYGLLSREPIYSLPEVIGKAYLPYHPGYVYAALPVVNDEMVK